MLPEDIRFTGYFPGAIGKTVDLHAAYYHGNWGFDISFETQVARELAAFFDEFREGRDFFLAALAGGEFAGCIAIDGKDSARGGARLRWFIVAPEHQGKGLGKTLIGEAVSFCRTAAHNRIFLWTFEGLDPARKLYERSGFRLAGEHRVRQWGQNINEQKFELLLD